ncbi:MAG: response regulator [Betaproteobacteria bacterium]|nr:response regulator [Betaproteobacteria bacterium]
MSSNVHSATEERSSARPVVLTVDDAEDIRELVVKTLGGRFQVKPAADGPSALRMAQENPQPDVILLDVMMVDMDGYKVCKALKENPVTASIPVIFLTGLTDVGDEAMGFHLGAVDYITKPINRELLRARVEAHVTLNQRKRKLEQVVSERTGELEKTNQQLVQRLARVVEHHEGPAFRNRIMRVSQYVHLLSQASGAKPGVAEIMMRAAPLYDIGKLAIPSWVLRKPGELDEAEWKMVKRHPEIGAEIIGEHKDPLLGLARSMSLTHHERWDGTGYPHGMKGEAIPWPGRVIAIVDTFEAMTTTQYRRDPIPIEDAAAFIRASDGKHFDPKLVAAFKKALPAMEKVRAKLSDALGEILDLDFTA